MFFLKSGSKELILLNQRLTIILRKHLKKIEYHLPGKRQKDIEVSSVVDGIEDKSKELIIMDRRIFLDDRGYTDDQIDYGQVLITK